ncbi:MAG: methylated-DNA--[protein]-cysteine S-methyltransferase [Bacteroides sp.]|jgi:AraC family transcriptional regulator of adaptative response/methylated-DNA-[protein]-cysteine methyltransferase|nr:methylated-DNA--[protein]-cysteine S-methyltransferase [Bacteroides sp.]
MNVQEDIDFNRIKSAIEFISRASKSQPQLEDIARQVNMSPFHFQRMFTEWAGVSPKQFLQYISITRAKALLKEEKTSLLDTAFEVGLSGTGRLHDLFVHIEGMTPGEYKNGGANLAIHYTFGESPFGKILVASTAKGICHLSFVDDEAEALAFLRSLYPNARYGYGTDPIQQNALSVLNFREMKEGEIKLNVKGTPFQLKVWEALLRIPVGKLTTYGSVATRINHPKACRAVGTAVGDNPVAFFIPCHRVIQSTGFFGQYHWGSIRKTAIIGWEGVHADI